MGSTDPIKFRYWRRYSVHHLIIVITKSDVSTSEVVWSGCTITFRQLLQIALEVMCSLWVSQVIGCGMVPNVVFALNTISSFIICVQNCLKALNIYFSGTIFRMCLRLSLFPAIFYAIYGSVWYQFTNFSYHSDENICSSSYHHHQIENMNY